MTDTIKTLQQMGLTEYEAKTYITLASLITSTADIISKESGVPRSKIYQTLDTLSEKKYITIKKGRPQKYIINPPNDIFNKYREKIKKEINETEKIITNLYESKLPNINTPIWTIEETEKINKKEYEIIKRAKNTLDIRIGFLLSSQIEKIKKEIKKALKRNVKIRILTVPYCLIENKKMNIKEIFANDLISIKYAPIPKAQLIIRDNKEMILVFKDEKNESHSNMIGLWNHYPTIISHYSNAFNKF